MTKLNQNQIAVTSAKLSVRTGVKVGALISNHSQSLTLRTGVKAGGLASNHSQSVAVALRLAKLSLRTGVKAGAGPRGSTGANHSQSLSLRTGLKAGGGVHGSNGTNHNQAAAKLIVRTNVKAGAVIPNHNQNAR